MADYPSYESLGGDATGTRIGDALFPDYAAAGQAPNPGMGVWFFRTAYDAATGMPIDAAIAKHQREWRQALGLQTQPQPGVEAPVAPREYAGNFCGVRVAGISSVPGGSQADPSLVLSWFYDRYSDEDRARIREAWLAKGYLDVQLSWPDSRAVGASPTMFAATCRELVSYGFRPCVFLLSKYYDPWRDVQGCLENINQVLPLLLSPRACSRVCIGWELGIPYNGGAWLLPEQVQQLTDVVAPPCLQAGIKTYVHFQAGYASFAPDSPTTTFATYWNRNVGLLTGLLWQADSSWDQSFTQAKAQDILVRFAGQFFCAPDSGFGHPFDCIYFEQTAEMQYAGRMDEATGDSFGRAALATPAAQGPFGPVRVMGSGNGF